MAALVAEQRGAYPVSKLKIGSGLALIEVCDTAERPMQPRSPARKARYRFTLLFEFERD